MSFLKGGLQLRRSHHHGQPQLRAARSRASRWEWGCRDCSRIAAMRSPEYSTASTPMPGIRRSDPYIERYYNASQACREAGQQARAATAHGACATNRKFRCSARWAGLPTERSRSCWPKSRRDLLELPAQLAVLGSGDAALQERFQALARSHTRAKSRCRSASTKACRTRSKPARTSS